MVLELTPGHTGPLLKQGATIPVQQTLPNVNTDEILASLDADTRDYLRLLVNAGGEGLRGQGPALSATLPALRAHRARPRPLHQPALPAPREPEARGA